MVMSHEGWRKRHPQSQEYELFHRGYQFGVNERDFWEEVSRGLCHRYDLDEETMVALSSTIPAGWPLGKT